MSWVQQSAAAPPSNLQPSTKSITQAQYQHQHQQHQPPQQQNQQQLNQQMQTTNNTPPDFSGKTALNPNQTTLPPPPSASHLQNHVQPTQATHYKSLSKVPPQQQFKSSQLQQQPAQQQQQPTYAWQYQQEQQQPQQHPYQQNNLSAMQPKPENNWQQPPQQQNNSTQQMSVPQQNSYNKQNANSWQQQYQQPPQPNMYDSYFGQEQMVQPTQQPNQQQQQYFQQNDLNAFHDQQPTQQHYNLNDYDNSNINSNMITNNVVNNNNNNVTNSKTSDSWGDWGDWNDNNSAENQQNHQQQQDQQQHHTPLNANVIEDSFNVHQNSSNETWQWNVTDNVAAVATSPGPIMQPIGVEKATVAIPTQVPTQPAAAPPPPQQLQPALPNQQQTQQPVFQVPSSLQQQQPPQPPVQQQSADFSVVTSKTATISSKIKPPSTLALPISAENNFNNLNAATTANVPNNNNSNNNIPNSVYLSQAKPVTRPSRQYASPPTGNTPLEAPENSVLLPTPPQEFQNDDPSKPIMPPPLMPMGVATANANPFKRAGAIKHHRAELMTATSFDLPPPPPADFANPSTLNLEPDNSEILHENQEVIAAPPPLPANITLPNAERNQYMQTSQLSENQDEEFNLEADSLPPPGLSRLVLGEPELEATQRLVTGTEEPPIGSVAGTSHMDMEERHADGEDNSVEQASNVTATNVAANRVAAAEISADRNLYQVAGESNVNNDRRVVTGVETAESITLSVPAPSTATPIRSDQREIELDGENLEDQQVVSSRNEPPLEGAVANSGNIISVPAQNNEFIEARPHHQQHSHQTKAAALSQKTQSNASTGNDSELELSEQHHQHHSQRLKSTRLGSGRNLDTDRRRDKQRSMERSFGSEEASEEYSSERDRERRRGYREGSARSDERRENRDRDHRNRREKRVELSDEKTRDKYYADRRKDRKDVDRHQRSGRYNRYEADETEESQPSRHDVSSANVGSRKELSRRSMRVHRDAHDDRSDREYDGGRYERTQRRSKREKDLDRSERRDDERRDKRGSRRGDPRTERDDFEALERRRRGDKQQYPRDYEEYRKQSSRNARDSDLEKEKRHARNGNNPQVPDPRFDPRLMYGGYPAAGQYGMDYYYYEHLARTNPKAYNEYYKKYYEQQQAMAAISGSQQGSSITAALVGDVSAGAAVAGGSSSLAATDGRESVHSGRSSAHNEKDRYTQAYMSQVNQYHRHYQQKAQYHSYQQQLQQQQQQQYQQQQLMGVASASYHHSLPLNSTFQGDTASVASFGSFNRMGRLSAAHSLDDISSTSSQLPAPPPRSMSGYYLGKGDSDCFADLRSNQQISSRDAADRHAMEQQRSTPCKFTSQHAVVSLSSGLLVTVKPKITSKGHLSNVVKLQRLGINDAVSHLYQSFPGPLVRGLTHKKTIIDFCEEQIRGGPTETTIYARQLTPRSVEKYRASYTLMWNLLILLLRQNGMVVGTDIAELLLRNQQQFPYNSIENSFSRRINSTSDDDDDDASVESLDGSAKDEDKEEKIKEQSPEDIASDERNENSANKKEETTSVASNSQPTLTEAEITEGFRNYLLCGNVNEALDWATDNNLWGHALFLASKVDRRSHANVMMKFANKLALNDPLQTLYQLMSGRTPSSVTSVQDEKWGDWRPHLSMILSNTSQKPELDRKAITTLGDSLFNRGDLYAAHFCYLMAQVGFGRYQESAVQETTLQQNLPKLVLLGSSHYKSFPNFATNEAIMMTEIYEYACSLNDEKFSLVEFQPYKYLLATRLLDYGFNLKSLMYMEQIALHIAKDPSHYEPSFINKVYEIADRLKYFDPVLEKSLDEQQQSLEDNSNSDAPSAVPQNFEEQKWLQSLRSIALQYKLDYPVPTPSSYPGQDQMQHQQDQIYLQSQINQEFTEINKQFRELNLQYASANVAGDASQYSVDNVASQQQEQHQQGIQESTEQQQQQQEYSQYPAMSAVQPGFQPYENFAAAPQIAGGDAPNVDAYGNYVQQQPQPQQGSYYDPNAQQQAYDAYAQQQNVAAYGGDYWAQQQPQIGAELNMPDKNSRPSLGTGTAKETERSATTITDTVTSTPTAATEQQQQKPRDSKKSTTQSTEKLRSNVSFANHQSKDAGAKLLTHQQQRHRMLYGTATKRDFPSKSLKSNGTSEPKSAIIADSPFLPNNNARPTITLPKSKTYDSDDEKQKTQAGQQQNSAALPGNQEPKKSGNAAQPSKSDAKDLSKSAQQANQNSGWFGGIWNKLSLKPKNQMILPDDKNPSIVWDAEKKRWINTDGDEAVEENVKPPPKMSEIMPQAQVQQQAPQMVMQQQQPQQQQQQPPMQQFSVADSNSMQPMPLASSSPFTNYSASAGAPNSSANAPAAAAKPPSLQSNMFKMQRNRTLKNSYVDVFNPSGAPMSKAAENVLAPALPPSIVPQGGFFIPDSSAGSGGAGSESSANYQQQQQQQQQETPQFYNPNQFSSTGY